MIDAGGLMAKDAALPTSVDNPMARGNTPQPVLEVL